MPAPFSTYNICQNLPLNTVLHRLYNSSSGVLWCSQGADITKIMFRGVQLVDTVLPHKKIETNTSASFALRTSPLFECKTQKKYVYSHVPQESPCDTQPHSRLSKVPQIIERQTMVGWYLCWWRSTKLCLKRTRRHVLRF